jgi:Phosphorylated CTD interacting factor 1 WW domain
MKHLARAFGVQQESFASPFNASLERFCSAFVDTDACFGSAGGFFSYNLSEGGSFQVGPPYNRQVVTMLAGRLWKELTRAEQRGKLRVCVLLVALQRWHTLLSSAADWTASVSAGIALAFVCVLPLWHDHQWIQQLRQSKFKVWESILVKHEHSYRSGMQHLCKDRHMYPIFDGSTLLLWLATPHAPEDWIPTASKVDAQRKFWQQPQSHTS